ncbi:MAG TPA: hypothetical protein VLM91_04850 [Candidatus Methylomirabilis sp.]|nr:hypothetical protein [Candidatus Methylomirabilis sp.]
MSAPETPSPQLDLVRTRSLQVGVLALLVCVAGAFFSPQQFFQSYLLAYVYWIGITLGCFALIMLYHMVGGIWGFAVRRLLETGVQTFPLMAVLFLPILGGVRWLYVWTRPGLTPAPEAVGGHEAYLNLPFFVVRVIAYFAIWIVAGYFLNTWSLEQDRTADPSLTRRLRMLSGPGLVVYGLTVTFASIDWVMSLEPEWHSTIYGMMYMVGFILEALTFIVVVEYLLSHREPLAHAATPGHSHDLGNLMLTFVILWAYLNFSQFLIIWAENLTDEIPWYLHRTTGGWQAVAFLLILFLFALPFLMLLSRAAKRRAASLSALGLAILVMRYVDVFWLVAPAFHPSGFVIHWMDVLAPVGIGGIWLWVFLGYLRGKALLPLHDPRYAGVPEPAHGARP